MSHNDSTINLDHSSILSRYFYTYFLWGVNFIICFVSTKNSSLLEVSKEIIDIESSDEEDDNIDVGNSISENIDSTSENLENRTIDLCSTDEEGATDNYVTRFVGY